TRFLIGHDLAAEILRFAGQENATRLVIGRARPKTFGASLKPTLAEDLVRKARGISVDIVTQDTDTRPPPARTRLPALSGFDPVALFWCVIGVSFAAIIGKTITSFIEFPNISLIFIVPVLLAATRFGIGPGIFTSVLSFAVYNFFFLPPLYTFSVARP